MALKSVPVSFGKMTGTKKLDEFEKCPCFIGEECKMLGQIRLEEEEDIDLIESGIISKELMELFKIYGLSEIIGAPYGPHQFYPNYVWLFLCPSLRQRVDQIHLTKEPLVEEEEEENLPVVEKPPDFHNPFAVRGLCNCPMINGRCWSSVVEPKQKEATKIKKYMSANVGERIGLTKEEMFKYNRFRLAKVALDHINMNESEKYKLVEPMHCYGGIYYMKMHHCVFRATKDTSSAPPVTFFAAVQEPDSYKFTVTNVARLDGVNTTVDSCVLCHGQGIPHPVD